MPDLIVQVCICWATNFRRLNVKTGSVFQGFCCNKYGQVKVFPSGFFFLKKMTFGKETRATFYNFSHTCWEKVLRRQHLSRKIWQICQMFLESVQYEAIFSNFYHRMSCFREFWEVLKRWLLWRFPHIKAEYHFCMLYASMSFIQTRKYE